MWSTLRKLQSSMGTGRFLGWTASRAAALCLLGAAMTGCMASGGVDVVADYPVVEVDAVPVQITSYPHVYYEGSDAYLVDGRWYYRSHDRWVVFRREPSFLASYRVEYDRGRGRSTTVYSAPPARPRRPHPQPQPLPHPHPHHHH